MDATQRAAQLVLLRDKVLGSKKPWVEGVTDFIEFESQLLASGVPRLNTLHDDDRTIAILYAAYLHGAFRGTCRAATLGESWCKGAASWGLVSVFMAVDIAGADAGNDAALNRIHAVIGAHHLAGVTWEKYRGAYPHKC